jgi:hypothetical protein
MDYKWWKSKTVWGAVLLAAGRIVVDRSPASWAENIGLVVGALGARSAIAKNGEGK